MAIESSFIETTGTDLVTVPSSENWAITTIIICNTFAVDPTNDQIGKTSFDLHLLQDGAVASDANRVINGLELQAGETFTFDSEKIILSEGEKIYAIGTPQDTSPGALLGNTSMSALVSYLEIT
jgi:hypothetical protein